MLPMSDNQNHAKVLHIVISIQMALLHIEIYDEKLIN